MPKSSHSVPNTFMISRTSQSLKNSYGQKSEKYHSKKSGKPTKPWRGKAKFQFIWAGTDTLQRDLICKNKNWVLEGLMNGFDVR